MGILLAWFQCDDVAELEKAKQKKLDMIEQLKEEVKAIDEKVAEQQLEAGETKKISHTVEFHK
jgi:hypothetical protein